jgi:hypothetical protein
MVVLEQLARRIVHARKKLADRINLLMFLEDHLRENQ